MRHLSPQTADVQIVCSDSLDQATRFIIERAREYETIILIFECESSGLPMAVWAERDRLGLNTQRVGEASLGFEVHTFGLEEFPEGTLIELSFRLARQDSSHASRSFYRSLLNELTHINVQILGNGAAARLS